MDSISSQVSKNQTQVKQLHLLYDLMREFDSHICTDITRIIASIDSMILVKYEALLI